LKFVKIYDTIDLNRLTLWIKFKIQDRRPVKIIFCGEKRIRMKKLLIFGVAAAAVAAVAAVVAKKKRDACEEDDFECDCCDCYDCDEDYADDEEVSGEAAEIPAEKAEEDPAAAQCSEEEILDKIEDEVESDQV
jgi:hypothetical protein